jgi:hypothetical protein
MAKTPYIAADGGEVPSVTQIAGRYKNTAFLNKWYHEQGAAGIPLNQTRDVAGDVGTAIHHMITSRLRGDSLGWPTDLSPENAQLVANMFLDWERWWEAIEPPPHIAGTEIPMISELFRFGGTLDCLTGSGSAPITIWDWKTGAGFYEDMLLQMSAYRHLVLECREVEVTCANIVRLTKTHKKIKVFSITADELKKGLDLFLRYRHSYELEGSLKEIMERIRKDAISYDYRDKPPGVSAA